MRVRVGHSPPKGYGLAWMPWTAPVGVYYPIPFNWIAGFVHEAYLWLQRGWRWGATAQLDEAWGDGYAEGVTHERQRHAEQESRRSRPCP